MYSLLRHRIMSPSTPKNIYLLQAIATRGFRATPTLLVKKEFLVAPLGEGISEVEILEWHVKPGDRVSEFDPICEVQTDKATTAISSRYEGVIEKLNYEIGDMAIVGTSLVTMDIPESASSGEMEEEKSTNTDKGTVASSAPEATRSTSNTKVLTTPAVRRIGKENNLDLSVLVELGLATGPNGRLLKGDVLKYLQDPSAASSASETIEQSTTISRVEAVDTVVKIRGIQKVMVQSMTKAASVPTMTLSDEVEMNKLVELRNLLKPEAEKLNIKLSYFPFMMKAASLAMTRFPIINSHISEDAESYTMKGSHNFGLAMDTPRGLVVPNIKDIQNKSIIEIAAELNRLQVLGAENRIGTEDLRDGTFCLSNIGSIGGTYASPILVVPQVVIGALGKMQRLPRFDKEDPNKVVATNVMCVSWTADHRIIDGATITSFSNLFKYYLENPSTMLIHLR